MLLTTHDLDEAEILADRILILAGGRIIADGSPDELSRSISTLSGGQRRKLDAAIGLVGRPELLFMDEPT
ncbi:ATP-binding cassette domain-containing protein, partial [Klebsiella pneumoniae subsp. pneumoniae]